MKKLLLSATLICGFSLAPVVPALQAAEEGISVTATGRVPVRPDMAVFDVTVQSVERDAGRAAARTAETWAALQRSLRSAGIREEDSTTVDYSVRPQWVWDQPSGKNVLKGFVARHVVRVTVRDLRRAGAAVDAAVGAGAGEVGDIRFVSSKQESLRREALDQAVRNAREDAWVMAKAAGGRLGTLVELISDFRNPPTMAVSEALSMKAMPAAPPTEITPGEAEISVTVHSRWRFVGAPSK